MRQIAISMCAFISVALPAHADGTKGAGGTIGMGAISAVICTLTAIYISEDEDSSGEGFDRRGFFIGVGGGFAGENFSNRPVRDIADIFSNQPGNGVPAVPGPETTATADDSWSIYGHAGYRCHPRYSINFSIESFGGFDTQWTGVLGAGSADIDIFAANVDIKGFLLTGRYQPYLLFGGGTMTINTKVTNPTGIGMIPDPDMPLEKIPGVVPITQSRRYTDFVFRFGGGIDVYATEHVVVNIGAKYLAAVGHVGGVDLFTVGGGIEYRF